MREKEISPETIRTSKLNFFPSLFNAFFFAGMCFYVLGPITEMLPIITEAGRVKLRLFGGGFCFILFLYVLSPFLSYAIGQKLEISSDSLRYRCGFFWKETKTLSIARVTGIETSESIWQRAIGAGDIIIMSGSLPRIVFRGVKNPVETAEHLQEICEGISANLDTEL